MLRSKTDRLKLTLAVTVGGHWQKRQVGQIKPAQLAFSEHYNIVIFTYLLIYLHLQC